MRRKARNSKKWLGIAILGVLGTVFMVGGVTQAAEGSGQAETRLGPEALFNSKAYRVVDLTHPFDENTIYWPTAPHGFKLEVLEQGETEAGYYYRANRFATPEHGGTHFDAPSHFHKDGLTAAEVPVTCLMGPAVVIDVRRQARSDRDYALSVARVKAWEKAHGAVPANSIVLLRTGWSRHWPNARAYLGGNGEDPDELSFPSFGAPAVRYLIEEREAAAIGVDSASIDPGKSKVFKVHQIVAANQVPALENLARLDELPETGAFVMALPMKIAEGSGSPVRVVAFVPKAG